MDKHRDELFKELINKKNLALIANIESHLMEYGKFSVSTYLDLVLFRIDQYQSLSSYDVVDILNEVYSLLYLPDPDDN